MLTDDTSKPKLKRNNDKCKRRNKIKRVKLRCFKDYAPYNGISEQDEVCPTPILNQEQLYEMLNRSGECKLETFIYL